jgi:uncharacterized cupredoxin-like copper-binding protein
MTRTRKAGFGLLAISIAGAMAACGGSTSTASSPPATEATAAPAAQPVLATAGEMFGIMVGAPKEFSLQPAARTAKSGKVTFSVTNAGKAVHEMVVLSLVSSSLDAVKAADGSAKEDTAVGEVADIDPGITKSTTIELPPGTYALICNEPGHFAGGMHQILTVS